MCNATVHRFKEARDDGPKLLVFGDLYRLYPLNFDGYRLSELPSEFC